MVMESSEEVRETSNASLLTAGIKEPEFIRKFLFELSFLKVV